MSLIKSYAEVVVQDGNRRCRTPLTRIFVEEASMENRYDNSGLGSERKIKPTSTQIKEPPKNIVKTVRVKTPSASPVLTPSSPKKPGKTTKKKEKHRSKLSKLGSAVSKAFSRKRNKVSPLIGKSSQDCVNSPGCSYTDTACGQIAYDVPLYCRGSEDIESAQTLFTRESDAAIGVMVENEQAGVSTKGEFKRTKERLFNIFGQCFGLFQLSRVESGTELFLTGNKIHVRPSLNDLDKGTSCGIDGEKNHDEISVKSSESDSELKALTKSIPYINIHGEKDVPRTTSGSTVVSIVNDPKQCDTSRCDTPLVITGNPAVKKCLMTQKDNFEFWDKIEGMEGKRAMEKLAPLVPMGTNYFEIQNDDESRPCTPRPELGRHTVKKTEKVLDLNQKLLSATSRRENILTNKLAPLNNRLQNVETRKIQFQQDLALKANALRDQIRERELNLEKRKEKEIAKKAMKLATENERKQKKLEELVLKQREEYELLRAKQLAKEAIIDGRRSAMLVGRTSRLRKHHSKVDKTKVIFHRSPSQIRLNALGGYIEPEEFLPEIESSSRPTSADEYQWSENRTQTGEVDSNENPIPNESDGEENGGEVDVAEDENADVDLDFFMDPPRNSSPSSESM